MALKTVQGVEPGTDPESWMQLAEKGDAGPQGPKGDIGDTGPQGLKGDTGDTGPGAEGRQRRHWPTRTQRRHRSPRHFCRGAGRHVWCHAGRQEHHAVVWLWWPASDDGAATKYARLERWAKLLAAGWQDKTYTLRFYNAQTSGDYNGTPVDDLADGREAAPLGPTPDEPVDDWTEKRPHDLVYPRNALSLADGTMNILALEGEDGLT